MMDMIIENKTLKSSLSEPKPFERIMAKLDRINDLLIAEKQKEGQK